MEPDDGAPKVSGLGESMPVAGERDAEPGRREVFLETRSECRVGGDSGDVGDQIFGGYVGSIFLRQKRQQLLGQIREGCFRIALEREDAATSAVVVIEIRDTGSKRKGWPRSWRCSRKRRQIDLLVRAYPPKFRVRAVDDAVVRDDPLPIERTKPMAYRLYAVTALIGNWLARRFVSGKAVFHHSPAVPVTVQVRMKEILLLVRWRMDELLPTAFQRTDVGRNYPRPARHHSGTIVDEKVLQLGVSRPRALRSWQEWGAPTRRTLDPLLAVYS